MQTARTIGRLLLAHVVASYTTFAVGVLCTGLTEGSNAAAAGLICIGLFAPLVIPCLALLIAISAFDFGPHIFSTEVLVGLGIYLMAFVITLKLRSIQWSREDRLPTGLCPRCSYDLTGNVSGVCSECGFRFKPRFWPPAQRNLETLRETSHGGEKIGPP